MSPTVSQPLRSISLKLDLDEPQRLAHFRATPKSMLVVQAVFPPEPESRASMVIAPYGSGKSLASAIGSLFVRGFAGGQAPEALVQSLESHDPGTCASVRARFAREQRGQVVVLAGHESDVAAALERESGRHSTQGAPLGEVLTKIRKSARTAGIDRLAIVWDEFGRHLEGLIQSGNPGDLHAIQELAEWAVRQTDPSVTLTLLMHRSFLDDVSNLSPQLQSSWRKIEGRFEVLNYVEDGPALYELLAGEVTKSRPKPPTPDRYITLSKEAKAARELGWFSGFGSAGEINSILCACWPLSPGLAYVLPNLAVRLGQHERTLVDFLKATDLSQPVSFERAYAYFSEKLRRDRGLGGAHRSFLATERARSQTDDPVEREILAACCLLRVGASVERSRLGWKALEFGATAGSDISLAKFQKAAKPLRAKKLLLHRQTTDDVSPWQGPDVDVDGPLTIERAKTAGSFDLLAFLARNYPAPINRPVRHNVERRVNRWWFGRYVLAEELVRAQGDHEALHIPPTEDGRVVYIIAESRQGLDTIASVAGSWCEPGVAIVLPTSFVDVREAALECAALGTLRGDKALLDQDPLVADELDDRLEAAYEVLEARLELLTDPSLGFCRLFTGADADITGFSVSEALSVVTELRFSKTPRISNEVLARRRISRQMVNARKKTLLGVLERSGSPQLGFGGMTTPDAFIYRTVFEATGLYRRDGHNWRWASPDEVGDPGLRDIWAAVKDFWSRPEPVAKSFEELIAVLHAPPFGLSPGFTPLLLAAGFRAFGKVLEIREDGVYVPDLLPSVFERLCGDPGPFSVEVRDSDTVTVSYLEGLIALFGLERSDVGTEELVSLSFEAYERWRRGLADFAFTTSEIAPATRPIQAAFADAGSPLELILDQLPAGAGVPPGPKALERLRKACVDLENVSRRFETRAHLALEAVLQATAHSSLVDRLRAWTGAFGTPAGDLDLLGQRTLGLLTEAAKELLDEVQLCQALGTLLTGRPFERWDDRTVRDFEDALQRQLSRIERAALAGGSLTSAMAPIFEERLEALWQQLAAAGGVDRARKFAASLGGKRSKA